MSDLNPRRPIPEKVEKYYKISEELAKIIVDISKMMPMNDEDLHWWIDFYMPHLLNYFPEGEEILDELERFTK